MVHPLGQVGPHFRTTLGRTRQTFLTSYVLPLHSRIPGQVKVFLFELHAHTHKNFYYSPREQVKACVAQCPGCENESDGPYVGHRYIGWFSTGPSESTKHCSPSHIVVVVVIARTGCASFFTLASSWSSSLQNQSHRHLPVHPHTHTDETDQTSVTARAAMAQVKVGLVLQVQGRIGCTNKSTRSGQNKQTNKFELDKQAATQSGSSPT